MARTADASRRKEAEREKMPRHAFVAPESGTACQFQSRRGGARCLREPGHPIHRQDRVPPPPSALAAAGGIIVGATSPAAAAGAGLAASANAQGDAVASAVTAVSSMLQAIDLRRRRTLANHVAIHFPETDVDAAFREEARREVVFRKRSEQRTRIGMKLAMKASDPSARTAAISQVMKREQRFAEQRTLASGARVLAAAELQTMRVLSPMGAYWSLGLRQQHTPDCIAMNGRFWPWVVLEKVHPLLHVGCGCFLLTFGEAVSKGLMTAGDTMSDDEALRLAAPVIKHVEEEEAEAARKYGHLAEEQALEELIAREALLEHHGFDADYLAAMPLGCDIVSTPAPPPVIREAAEHTDGAMVALYPDARRAKKLAIPRGEKPDELHITLAFLGKAEKLDLEAAKKAVAAWAKKTPPQRGTLSGIGHFDIGKGKKVTYRSVDLPDIAQPREDLVAALDRAKVPASKDHGFTPHMTIDYGVRRPPIEKAPISFSKVTLTWGEDTYDFSLDGKP